jgi:hypothetical protein
MGGDFRKQGFYANNAGSVIRVQNCSMGPMSCFRTFGGIACSSSDMVLFSLPSPQYIHDLEARTNEAAKEVKGLQKQHRQLQEEQEAAAAAVAQKKERVRADALDLVCGHVCFTLQLLAGICAATNLQSVGSSASDREAAVCATCTLQ